jgi:ribosomal protein L7Ae-like RNA K-turn-binding protein
MIPMNPKIFQWLGLAFRAGKIVHGEEGVLKSIRSKQARVVLIADDASESTLKKFTDKCSFYDVPLKVALSRDRLGQAIGKPERVIVAVTDPGFAKRILDLM